MKILMLGWELPPHNSGGLGVACLNLSQALANEGAEIDFVVPYAADHSELKFMHVVSALKLDPLCRFGISAYDSQKIETMIFPDQENRKLISIRDVQKRYCEFVEKYLMEYKPDVVHAHDWLTFEAGVLAKKNRFRAAGRVSVQPALSPPGPLRGRSLADGNAVKPLAARRLVQANGDYEIGRASCRERV